MAKKLNNSQVILNFKGGVQHNSLIIAEAKLKDEQEQENNIIYLQCKWFLIDPKNSSKKSIIDGISTGFYQVSYEDIGYKLEVQATPILDGYEFYGQPLIERIGPIEENKSTSQEGQNMILLQKPIQFLGRIERVEKLNENIVVQGQDDLADYFEYAEFPKDLIMKINQGVLELDLIDFDTLELEQNIRVSLDSSQGFPVIKMVKKTNNFLEMQINYKYNLRIKAQNNQQRDLIYYMVEYFKKMVKEGQIQVGEGSIQGVKENLLGKFQQVEENLNPDVESSKLYKDLKNEFNQIKEQSEEQSKQMEEMGDSNDRLKKNIQKLETELNEIKIVFDINKQESQQLGQKYHSLLNEKQIYLQDNQQIKLQLKQKEQIMEEQELQILQYKQELENQSVQQEYQDKIVKLEKQLQIKEQDVQNQEVYLQKITDELSQFKQDNENKLAEINHWKKKYQSLRSESSQNMKIIQKQQQQQQQQQQLQKQHTLPHNFSLPPENASSQDGVSNPSFHNLSRRDSSSTNNSSNCIQNNQNIYQNNKEIERLKGIISQQEQRLEKLREDYNQEIQLKADKESEIVEKKDADKKSLQKLYKNIKNGKVSSNNIKQQHTYMQKLVNSLTENLEEKQLSLDNQLKINKQLVDKVLYQDQRIRGMEKESREQYMEKHNNNVSKDNNSKIEQKQQLQDSQKEKENVQIQQQQNSQSQSQSQKKKEKKCYWKQFDSEFSRQSSQSEYQSSGNYKVEPNKENPEDSSIDFQSNYQIKGSGCKEEEQKEELKDKKDEEMQNQQQQEQSQVEQQEQQQQSEQLQQQIEGDKENNESQNNIDNIENENENKNNNNDSGNKEDVITDNQSEIKYDINIEDDAI